MKITLLYQASHYIRVKTKKYKELGPAKSPCYKRVLLYPTSFITRFHCITLGLSQRSRSIQRAGSEAAWPRQHKTGGQRRTASASYAYPCRSVTGP